MVIEIIVEKKDKKVLPEKHLYEFTHITIRCGVLGSLDGDRVLYDENDVDPMMICPFPSQILTQANDGEIVKFVEGYKTFDKYEEPISLVYDGDMYVMENGKTVGKF